MFKNLTGRLWLLYLLILGLFLEGQAFSFYFLGARWRLIQILEVLGVFLLSLGFFIGKIKIRKSPLALPLYGYLGINFLSIVNGVWLARNLKILLLLLSLVILYQVVYSLINSRDLFDKSFNLLLIVGLAEILFGLYQVVAGAVNHYFGAGWFIGHLGVIQQDFIGSFWGRPYGTMFEPDWYGAIAMFYALVFLFLYYSKIKGHKKFYLAGLLISLLGLFLSYVRAAWFGFVFGLFVFLYFKRRFQLKASLSKVNLALYGRLVLFLLVLFFLAVGGSQNLRNTLITRFHPTHFGSGFSLENQRLIYMSISFNSFLDHPLIGNGPGSAASSYLVREKGRFFETDINNQEATAGIGGFDFSLLTTILEDTGIMGLLIFIWLLASIIKCNIKNIRLLEEKYQLIALALITGLSGLFFSYLITQGLWLPFTWVFLAFNMAVLNVRLFGPPEKADKLN